MFDFPHEIVANQMRKAGMTSEVASKEVEAIFKVHGHFPKCRKLLVKLDALKSIAY